ncbi:MAG: hydrogenase maturation nickel metallochaperone HypA [Candidatus Bipolaricaulia bacterium]
MVDALIRAVLPRVAEHPGRIRTLVLKKGELRILSDRALGNAFEILSQGTRLAGAQLVVELVPTIVACSACGYRGAAERLGEAGDHFSTPVLACPVCAAPVDIVAGRELYIDRVTLSDPPSSDA